MVSDIGAIQQATYILRHALSDFDSFGTHVAEKVFDKIFSTIFLIT